MDLLPRETRTVLKDSMELMRKDEKVTKDDLIDVIKMIIATSEIEMAIDDFISDMELDYEQD